jgi:hypothetical protein
MLVLVAIEGDQAQISEENGKVLFRTHAETVRKRMGPALRARFHARIVHDSLELHERLPDAPPVTP